MLRSCGSCMKGGGFCGQYFLPWLASHLGKHILISLENKLHVDIEAHHFN